MVLPSCPCLTKKANLFLFAFFVVSLQKRFFFVKHFFQSLPGIPSRRARQQVRLFFKFSSKSLPVGPDDRFKVFLTKIVFEGRGTTQQKKVRFFWRKGHDNRFKVFRRKTYLSRRDRLENLPGIPSLPFSAFFEEKGWKRMKRKGYQFSSKQK